MTPLTPSRLDSDLSLLLTLPRTTLLPLAHLPAPSPAPALAQLDVYAPTSARATQAAELARAYVALRGTVRALVVGFTAGEQPGKAEHEVGARLDALREEGEEIARALGEVAAVVHAA
ncbi:hypothetical protein Q5752_003871 [Cryptotrichosporon argae]